MSISQSEFPLFILHQIESFIYLALIIFLAFRRRERAPAAWLLVYALIAFAFQQVRMLADFGWLPIPIKLSDVDFQRVDQYGAILLSFIFYQTLRTFFEKE